MTLIAGQKFFQGIVLIADSRASIEVNGQIVPWRDNTQKLFRLDDHLFIGFAGDIEFAGAIISFLIKQIGKRKRLGELHVFYNKGPKLIRYAYNILKERFGAKSVYFMIGGVDFKRRAPIKDKNGKLTGYMSNIFDKKLFRLISPEFNIEEANIPSKPFLIMGSGEAASLGLENDFRDLQFSMSANLPLSFQASLIEISLKERIKKLGIDTVGGLFQIVTIDNNGSRFLEYKCKGDNGDKLNLELIIKNGRLVQRNLSSGKESLLLFPPEILEIADPSVDLFADIEI